MHSHICEHTHPTLTHIWHSDISLVELANETVKEDDRAVLLEGGGLQSASPKARSSPVTSHVVRFLLMDETFLLENRLTLRAISEFGVLLIYFYFCDCTILFGESKKGYNRDLFLFLYFLLIIVSAITSFKIHHDKSPISGKSILYLNRHQTEEWKGWKQSSDPADNDAWKDKGTGQLAIKCKEGVNKGTRESKPTFLVRNDVGKVLLNALLYPGIKTNMQKNSIVAIFHTAGGLVEADRSSFSFGVRASSKNLPSGANIRKLIIFSYVQEANAPVSCREEMMFSKECQIMQLAWRLQMHQAHLICINQIRLLQLSVCYCRPCG